MSRSRRKTPIFGYTTADSEAFDKKKWHRAFRRAVNKSLQVDPEREPDHIKQFFNPWDMHKDGKGWWHYDEPPNMRK